MAAKIEYKGKDVAEAIRIACENLNVPREQLDIEIVNTGSTGIFGLLRKKATIRVSRREEEATGAAEPSKSRFAGRSERGKGRGGAARPSASPAQKGPAVQREIVKEEEQPITFSQATLDAIKNDLDTILKLMGFPSDVSLSTKGNKVMAHIGGEFLEQIVGADGQTLDGLQYVMRKVIARKFPEKILFALDAGDFRESRAKELEEMSLKLAQEVKETGKTHSIPALNPAERRIVHMVLQEDTTIRSRSVGDGLFKKILIYVPGKGKKKAPRRRKSNTAREQ